MAKALRSEAPGYVAETVPRAEANPRLQGEVHPFNDLATASDEDDEFERRFVAAKEKVFREHAELFRRLAT
jgi:hypothetical protein